MRRIALRFIVCLAICLGITVFPAQNAEASVPAVAASVGKALLKYFGKQGGEEATEYLSRKGGK